MKCLGERVNDTTKPLSFYLYAVGHDGQQVD